MKDKKAQINIGWFLVAAVSILVGLVLLNPIADTVVGTTSTNTFTNKTQTSGTLTADTEIVGFQDVEGTYVIRNTTGAICVAANCSLVTSRADGTLRLYMHVTNGNFTSQVLNITGTLEPTGYIKESAGRSVTLLIILMSVLALVIFSIPNLREYLDF